MDAQQNGAGISLIREAVRAAIGDMLFLSESEAGLELLPEDDALHSQSDVQVSLNGISGTMDTDAFLASIRSATDPTDAGLSAYLEQWESLFALLRSHTADICVYRSGADPVTITISAIIQHNAVLIRTTAVET